MVHVIVSKLYLLSKYHILLKLKSFSENSVTLILSEKDHYHSHCGNGSVCSLDADPSPLETRSTLLTFIPLETRGTFLATFSLGPLRTRVTSVSLVAISAVTSGGCSDSFTSGVVQTESWLLSTFIVIYKMKCY